MNKKVIIGIAGVAAVLIIVGIIFIILGLGGNGDGTSGPVDPKYTTPATPEEIAGTPLPGEKRFSVGDVDVLKMGVEIADKTFNFSVVFANNTTEEQKFDMTKFEIKKDGVAISIDGDKTATIQPNSPYRQMAFPINNPGDLKEGDQVDIYFNNEFVETTTVVLF